MLVNPFLHRSLATALLLLAAVAWTGCGEDPAPRQNVVPKDQNNDDHTNNPDQPDAGDDTDAEPDVCEGPSCGGGTIIDDGECKDIDDRGLLAVDGGPVTFEGSTDGGTDHFNATCAHDEDPSIEHVFAFRPEASAFVDLTLRSQSAIDWVHEIREGTCEATTALYCRDAEASRFLARQDETYFIVVEPTHGIETGSFALDLELTPVVCDDIGGQRCEDDRLTVCAGGLEELSFACATGCASDRCIGDVCDDAIAISQAGAHRFEGDLEAFSNSFDSKDLPTCNLDGALETPGAEVVFSLPGLRAGQTITVEAGDDENDNAIFILPSCGANAECLTAVDLNDRLEWEVPDDGDYLVIIDSLSELAKPFDYTIQLD